MSAPRCNPGDLAVIVRAIVLPEMLGRFVIVEKSMPIGAFHPDGYDGGVVWLVRCAAGGKMQAISAQGRMLLVDRRPIRDCNLRPIRPDAGEDEMLRIAGLPNTLELA